MEDCDVNPGAWNSWKAHYSRHAARGHVQPRREAEIHGCGRAEEKFPGNFVFSARFAARVFGFSPRPPRPPRPMTFFTFALTGDRQVSESLGRLDCGMLFF
jgi:hypothetical protein